MNKVTISDFSGGIQESTIPDDFSGRQWAELRGIIPSDELNFESQWGMQTLGTSFTGVTAVYPLESTKGTFLVAIKTDGSLWWCKPPSVEATYTVANAMSGSGAVAWTQLTQGENYGWGSGDANVANTTKPTILSNTDYKFICTVPFLPANYLTEPASGDLDNVSKDKDRTGSPLGVTSGVLIHSTTRNGSPDDTVQQALVVYVDPAGDGTVKAVVFPAIRRFPTHGDQGDFINAKVVNSSGVETVVSVSDGWPLTYSPSVRMHPYTYLDDEAALLPGRGIVPRGNVGCMNGNILMLGDIEWRSSLVSTPLVLDSVSLTDSAGSKLFGTADTLVMWPNTVSKSARVIYNKGGGVVYVKQATGLARTVTNKQLSTNVATLTTSANHSYSNGDKVEVVNVDPVFNGVHTITASTPNTFSYALTGTDVPSAAVTDPLARSYSYKYRLEVGKYQALPNSWTDVYVVATAASTEVLAAQQLDLATHTLNDANTGPYRGAVYFSTGDIDVFDPRAVLLPGRADVQVLGMHQLDDSVIVITSAGSNQDGVFRIRGALERVISYSGQSDPTAVRLELVRGGLGGPIRVSNSHRNFSTVWSEAGSVVFIDRLGGVWYTNGQECERLDRYGPKAPNFATEADHVAAFNKHLFVSRNNRLLCFTIMAADGQGGSGCWTELVKAGTISSVVGGSQSVYMVSTVSGTSRVMRMSPHGLDAERGCIDGVAQTITVSTASIGEVSDHKRTTWHRFGMTFTTPTSCTVGTVKVQSTGALNLSGSPVLPDVQYQVSLNRTYNNKGVIGEFTVPAGIGPQAMASATVTFTGYVQLQSASFWVTGQTPRVGDL